MIAVAPNSGVFDTVADWIKKLDVPVTIAAGGIDTYVYHVKYGRADCLASRSEYAVWGPFGRVVLRFRLRNFWSGRQSWNYRVRK